MTSPSPDHPPRRMSETRYRILILMLVGGALLALFFGVRATDTGGDDAVVAGGRDIVERLVPAAGDEVIRQAELGIDLAPGYEAALLVNGVEIPANELRIVPEQNQVFFAPGEDKTVDALPAGPNCATALVWKTSAGRGGPDDETFTWCFDAL